VASISGAGKIEFYPTHYGRRVQDIDMIIPSIFLPITLELFDVHFNRFFLDYSKYPDFLKYFLTRIEVGKVGYRYIIELEGQDPSTTPTPKRVINEIEALVIDDKSLLQ
jgi:hypothetical protein